MRPALGRTYTIARDLDIAMASLSQLGFRHEPQYDIDLGGVLHHTLVLDFGLGSIEEWLSRHLKLELTASENPLLDIRAHALQIDGMEIGLSKLEFAVINFLSQRPSEVVSRAELLHAVWGIDFEGGSNVVDVVIGSLRRKLGPYRHCIGTAHGIGYRFIPPREVKTSLGRSSSQGTLDACLTPRQMPVAVSLRWLPQSYPKISIETSLKSRVLK